jgi:SAM-dependent methyltransferase
MPERTAVEAAWDREYEHGRYRLEPPLAFTDDIVAAANNAGMTGSPALYIGCGNGRNFVPLLDSGLDLLGLDISAIAVSQLRARLPDRADRLIHGDLSSLPTDMHFGCVVAIQVFQHGDGATARAHIERAKELVQPGGIIAIRVNATQTELEYRHDLVETEPASGYTVRYREGSEGRAPRTFLRSRGAGLLVRRQVRGRPSVATRHHATAGAIKGLMEPVGRHLAPAGAGVKPRHKLSLAGPLAAKLCRIGELFRQRFDPL